MKIMAIIPSLRLGGAERVLSLLSSKWSIEHDVTIVAFDGSRAAYHYGGRVFDLGLLRPTGLIEKVRVVFLSMIRLAALFAQKRPDRIVAMMEPANFPAAVAVTVIGMRRRLIVSVHHDPRKVPLGRRVLIRILYHLPAVVVAVSRGVASELMALGIPRARVVTINNPTVAGMTDQTIARPFQGSYVLAVGRLHPDKGFDRLLSAFALVEHSEPRLVVLGDGAERESLLALANRLGIGDRVRFPGSVVNIEAWYRNASCFVLASRTEAFSMSLVEAMTNGCPVVSFDCDHGPREIVCDSRYGFLVEDGDLKGLATAIERVLYEPGLKEELSAGGLERAGAYHLDSISAKWIDTMEAIG